CLCSLLFFCVFFFQAEDGIRDRTVTGVQTCALPISQAPRAEAPNLATWASARASAAMTRPAPTPALAPAPASRSPTLKAVASARSEERRVGKEWRTRWSAYQ